MENVDPSFFNHSPTAKQWERVGVKNHHGLVIPLFSLRSEQSCGIGEYLDLLPMVDWCASIGFDVIQLLPLNDTGTGTSPYSALSAFALNPIHLSLASLPHLHEHPLLLEELKTLPKLPNTSHVQYPIVRDAKRKFLEHYYQLVGTEIKSREDYKTFIDQSSWINEYALFISIKEANKWSSWVNWSPELLNPSADLIQKLFHQYQTEIEWHSFLQYLCHIQLKEVSDYAQKQNVNLMGDIPILISYDSADVWLHRDLFHMDLLAGAPPDMYSEEGQNWGFPIYNWDQIAKQHYKIWIERVKTVSQYYQIYRLDHIVGFFRIWAIPVGLKSKDGHYFPADQNIWIDHGQKILLALIDNCSMLPIGEDLGNIPPIVRTCLNALGICGTKVMRWEREWETTRKFIPVGDYPVTSMTTVSTHDSETLQHWWKNSYNGAKDYAEFKGWSYTPVLSRDNHYQILWESHHSNSLFHINMLQEYLALIPGLTDSDPENERINIPGIISDQNWSYRFKPSVEEIIQNQTLSHFMKDLIK